MKRLVWYAGNVTTRWLKNDDKRGFPRAQVAQPRAEHVGDGGGAAHDATPSITVSWQRCMKPSHIHLSGYLTQTSHTAAIKPLRSLVHNHLNWASRESGLSLIFPGHGGWQRNMFTCPLHLRDWQSGRRGASLELSCSVFEPSGTLGCPPNTPDAYPFHTISLRVTNSSRSTKGNG